MSKKQDRIFQPERTKKSHKLRWFLIAFFSFLLVLVIVFSLVASNVSTDTLRTVADKYSVGWLMNLFDDNSDEKVADNSKTDDGIAASVLIMSADEESGELRFLCLVGCNKALDTIKIFPLEVTPQMSAQYKSGSGSAVMSYVNKKYKIKADRYISSNDDTFALAVNYMGGLEYTVKKRVEYRADDYTCILTKGRQTIKGEMLNKYLRYCNTLGTEGLNMEADIFKTMINNYFTADNINNGTEIYKNVLTKINADSDISFVDASDSFDEISEYVSNKNKTVTQVNNTNDFLN